MYICNLPADGQFAPPYTLPYCRITSLLRSPMRHLPTAFRMSAPPPRTFYPFPIYLITFTL